MRRLARFVLLVAWASAAFAAEPKWIHVPSTDFEIFSTAGESDTRRVLQYLERVRSFFAPNVPQDVKLHAERVRVIVFGSKKEYEQYRPNSFADAFYTQIAGRDYIVLGGVGDDVFPIAVHEYVHLVVQHAGMTLPPWLNEGMAEVFSTMKPLGDKVLVGNIIPGRVIEMTQGKWAPLETILTAGLDSPYYNETNKAGSLYNEGWALTLMLELSPQYAAHFSEMLHQIAAGTPSITAIQNAYNKPLAWVEKDLQLYLRQNSFTGRVFPVKLQDGENKAVVEPANLFDVKLSLIDLGTGHGKEAANLKLRDLASEYPKRPEPQSALGYMAWNAGDSAGAVKDFAAAFELGGRNPQMLWDYGRLAANSDPASAGALNALLELQPSRVDVRLELASIQLSGHHGREAIETLSAIKAASAADAARYYEIRAFAHMENRDADAAHIDAIHWFENTKDPAEKARAKNFIDAVNASTSSPRPTLMTSAAIAPDLRDSGPPRIARSDTPDEPRPAPVVTLPSMRGAFTNLDCSSDKPRLTLQTVEGRVAFILDQPDKVILSGLKGATVDMNCGPQKAAAVTVEYEPSTASGIKGNVRAIRFEPELQTR
jgi:hypothetical protein